VTADLDAHVARAVANAERLRELALCADARWAVVYEEAAIAHERAAAVLAALQPAAGREPVATGGD
jgi:hypothetical protein